MRLLNRPDTLRALPMPDAISAMREAFTSLHNGRADIPGRSHLQLGGLTALTMPGVVLDPPRVGAKLISVVPENARIGRPVIQGVVVLFDEATGAVKGLVEGQTLTALRTGAVSGLATEILARHDSRCLAMIGSGPQAYTQVEAVCCTRPIERVRIFSRTKENATSFASRLQTVSWIPEHVDVVVADSIPSAVIDADVICTATRATEPVLRCGDVRPGVHINAVGSYTLNMRELDSGLIEASRVVVDDVEAALQEAGELVKAIEDGVFTRTGMTPLGAIVTGSSPGRQTLEQITVFKSVGLAVQDLCAAAKALATAEERGVGEEWELAIGN